MKHLNINLFQVFFFFLFFFLSFFLFLAFHMIKRFIFTGNLTDTSNAKPRRVHSVTTQGQQLRKFMRKNRYTFHKK